MTDAEKYDKRIAELQAELRKEMDTTMPMLPLVWLVLGLIVLLYWL